ncbi:MAG: L,D-transpeptidase family protein [Hyphomicrobiaceae bacterium]
MSNTFCVVPASLVLLLSFAPCHAVEPGAPEQLISEHEAFSIAVRRQLDELPSARDAGESSGRLSLAKYYGGNVGPPLWVTSRGLTQRAQTVASEIRNAESWGLDSSEFDLPQLAARQIDTQRQVADELKMSLAVLQYARHASGGRMDPKKLSLAIDRTPPLADPFQVLDTLGQVTDPVSFLHQLHPKHEQFQLLRRAYLDALEQETKGATQLGKKRRSKSKTKLSQRLRYNMEMWRWMPRDLGRRFVWANIPEYKVRVIDQESVIHEERVVTGKVKNMTPMFSDEMETVVFHPFWGVPNSIKVKELLPSLRRGRNILRRRNLKLSLAGRDVNPYSVDWWRTDIRNYYVYQPPGRSNALGIVKFMFPNKHAVYMHDTPSKHLFKRKKRAYSHGCVRVRNPLKLAEVVLGADKGWTRSQIDALIKKGPQNNQVALNTKVPVHVTYFTARIDSAGRPEFYKDVYDHEKLIQMGFDGKAHLIVLKEPDLEPDLRQRPRQVARQRRSRPNRSRPNRRKVARSRPAKRKYKSSSSVSAAASSSSSRSWARSTLGFN